MPKHITSEAEREYQHNYQAVYRRTTKARSAHQRHNRKFEAKHPDRQPANNRLNKAVQKGFLIRSSCDICGTTERIEAHHDDYSKPLDIRWLCERHHKEHHARMRPLT